MLADFLSTQHLSAKQLNQRTTEPTLGHVLEEVRKRESGIPSPSTVESAHTCGSTTPKATAARSQSREQLPRLFRKTLGRGRRSSGQRGDTANPRPYVRQRKICINHEPTVIAGDLRRRCERPSRRTTVCCSSAHLLDVNRKLSACPASATTDSQVRLVARVGDSPFTVAAAGVSVVIEGRSAKQHDRLRG